MSDPISIAGSAVGVVSLGISVLQGLVRYCSKYKNKDADVAALSSRCEALQSIFELLQPRLREIHHDPPVIAVLDNCITSCQSTLTRLLDQLQKL